MRDAKQKKMFDISDLRRSENLQHRSVCPFFAGGGGGGGTLIFSYIPRLGLFTGVQNFEFQFFFGFFRLLNIFGGMKIL